MQIGNIDTLEISFDVKSYDSIFEPLLARIKYAKEISIQNRKNNSNVLARVNIYNQIFEVLPNGTANHAYILHGEYYEINFAQGRSRNISFFPISIRAKSVGLWEKSPGNICGEMIKLIQSINYDIDMEITERVKRVDLCCHTDSFSVNSNTLDAFQGRYMSNNIRMNNKTIETYELGSRSNPVFCRIYNKSKEVTKKKNKLWFFDIWENSGFNDTDVWNIEFELKREFLNDTGINTIYDLFYNLNALWSYCTQEWLQHKELTNTRIERCPVSQEWKEIQSAFKNYEGKSYISRRNQNRRNAVGMLPTIIGYITKYGAFFDGKTIEEIYENLLLYGGIYLKDKKNTTYEEVLEKKRKLRKEYEDDEE